MEHSEKKNGAKTLQSSTPTRQKMGVARLITAAAIWGLDAPKWRLPHSEKGTATRTLNRSRALIAERKKDLPQSGGLIFHIARLC